MDNQPEKPRRQIDPSDPPPAAPILRTSPGHLWPLAKQIDGLGGEWTFQIFTYRVINFHFPQLPVLFYEPIPSFDRLALEALMSQRATGFIPDKDCGGITVATEVYPSIFDATGTPIPMPGQDECCIGNHASAVLGVHDEHTVAIRNAWPGWSEGGIGFLTDEYFNRYATEAWISRIWNEGPMSSTAESLLTVEDKQSFLQLWTAPRRSGYRFENHSSGYRIKLGWCESWSLSYEVPVEVLTLNIGKYLRVGVVILAHPNHSDDPTSCISDCFVWPVYRRKGFASTLERYAVERSKKRGARKMGIYLWNADAVKGEERALKFAQKQGYLLEAVQSHGQAVMYGEKLI